MPLNIKQIGSNQLLVVSKNGSEYLISYEEPVAGYSKEFGYWRTEDFWSRTTSKHINRYLKGIDDPKILTQEQIENMIDFVK
jgi:hypothetical protein